MTLGRVSFCHGQRNHGFVELQLQLPSVIISSNIQEALFPVFFVESSTSIHAAQRIFIEMPFQTAPANRNRQINVQKLDTEQLSPVHEWEIYAQTDISFRHIVEENQYPRADALRYKLIADINLEGARTSFSRACSSTTLFKIPDTIMCDRTFVRDAFEAYYVDAMYHYLHLPYEELRVEDIPLLKYRLHSRYFCAFAKKHVYLNEHFERRRLGHWVPGDSPDLDYFTDLEKVAWFPQLEAWVELLSQPSAPPVPLSFAIFYHHAEMRNAERFPQLGDSERVRRLRFCAKHETYALFLVVWWNVLYYGGKALIVKTGTIDILNASCGNVPDIAGRPAQAIIERMRTFTDMPQLYHNWLCFTDRSMERSAFIFAVKKFGIHDHTVSAGRKLWRRRDHRSVTVSQHSKTTYRRVAVLEERLADPDLDDVPGLLSLVREQEWAQYSSIRVGDLLHNLLALYVKTHSKLDEVRQQLQEEEKEHDEIKKDYTSLRDDLKYAEKRVEDRNYQLEAANSQVDNAFRQLDDAHRELDFLKHQRNDPRPATPNYAQTRGDMTPMAHDDELSSPEYNPDRDNNANMNLISTSSAQRRPLSATPTPDVNVSEPARNNMEPPVAPSTEALDVPTVRTGPAVTVIGEEVSKATGEPNSEISPTTAPASSSDVVPRPLRKIKPGYLFHPMPKPTTPRARSAQTQPVRSSSGGSVPCGKTATGADEHSGQATVGNTHIARNGELGDK